jgi:hypothetical protein
MKGEKGICTIGIGNDMIRRTKYDTKDHAQEACDFHISMGFVHADYIIYKCKVCGMFHFGKPEWAEKYSKI